MGQKAPKRETVTAFTSKERDAEMGLDYLGARSLSASQGTFTSPDLPFADQHAYDPQSWNLYLYVRNNPLRRNDPSGRKCVDVDGGGQGDDRQPGKPCGKEAGLDLSHGLTVNGNGGSSGPVVYGNAFLRGDLQGGRIDSAAGEILNAVPAAKIGLAIGKIGLAVGPLAVVVGKDALQHILTRHAANTAAQNVSKFSAGLSKDAIEGLVNAALKDGIVTQGSKVAFYDLEVRVVIGTNQSGVATSSGCLWTTQLARPSRPIQNDSMNDTARITYRISDEEWHRTSGMRWNPEVFPTYYCFLGHVSFRIGSHEVLGTEAFDISVADLAVGLATVLRELRAGGIGTFKFNQGDDILEISFRAGLDSVTVSHNLTPGSNWTCSRSALEKALIAFVVSFSDEAASRVPDVYNWRDLEILQEFSTKNTKA